MNQVTTHVLRLRDAYRRASATMPAIGLNTFDHPVDFNELRLPDLVSFFTYISEELSRLRAMVGAELDKEGLRAAVQPFHPLHYQCRAPREVEGHWWCLGSLCMGMSMSRRNMTVGSNSDGADQSL